MSAESDAQRAWKIMRALVADDDRRAEVTEAVGLSFWRAKALRRIAAHSPTLSELAAILQTDAPYITVVVRDLEERGLVVRTANPADGRSKVVRVTDAGAHCAARAESILNRPSGGLSNLPAEDIAVLVNILERAVPPARARQRQ
jgi:DNA-binding MarR family transcriptional regulator